ncbi:DNA repair protein [Lasiodiplodia theobromae]|uniref:DNA repair protein n=1 Tax=Lasiodiplodia theobromae TaxID=45133 RepID=UPI0015C3BF45|nr:DNA repair protein [Lasiodiplodia theobromae]KAF4542762.1 DNA repair protein [Lasiodiplodia theobromae]
MSSRGSSEQYISELEEQLQELLEKNEELEKKIQQQNKDNKVLEDKLVSAQTSRDWAEGEREELVAQLAKTEAERREAVGALALDTDQYTREIKGLHETLDGLQAEYLKKLEYMNSRCSKHAGNLLAANAKLEERTREVKELRAQLGVSPQEPPPPAAEEEEERKKSWATDFSTDFGGPVAFGDSATRTLADELGDEFSSEPGSPPSSSRPHSPTSAASPFSSRPHSPTSAAASPAPSASYDSDDGSNATGVTYDDDNRPDDTDDGTHATGLTHDDDHDTSSHIDHTVEHEDAQIEQEEPIAEQDEPEVQENEPQVQEDEPAEEEYPEEEATKDETAADENEQGLTTTTEANFTDDDELGFTGSEFAEDDSTELQDQPAGAAASPYGPLKSLLMQERPLAFDDHNPYEEAFRPASPVYGQPDSNAAGPSDALQAVQMFPQERAARNNLARAVQEEKTKLDAAIADLQQEKADEVQAIKVSMNDYLEELDARRIQDLQDADLRRVQDLEAADARRLTDFHEAQSKIMGIWRDSAERIRFMLQYLAALEFIIRQQGIDVSYLEDRRPDAKKTEDELNEMASRNDLVVSPMRLAVDIHPKELIADIPSIRISPPSEESSPTTTAPPPNSPTSDDESSPTSPTSPTAAFAATGSACPRLHVYLWPLLAFLFTLLTLFWFAGLSEAERKLWDDANDGARLSTLGHFGYGGRLSYRLFTPVSRTLYNADGGYLGPDDGQQVWMHPLVRVSAALVEPVFASVQVVVAGFAVVVGCLVGLR